MFLLSCSGNTLKLEASNGVVSVKVCSHLVNFVNYLACCYIFLATREAYFEVLKLSQWELEVILEALTALT